MTPRLCSVADQRDRLRTLLRKEAVPKNVCRQPEQLPQPTRSLGLIISGETPLRQSEPSLNAAEAFALAFGHPIAHSGQVRYGNVGMGQRLQVRRRAKLGSQRRVRESAFLLRPPDLFPPRFMRGEMRGVFRGGWIGTCGPSAKPTRAWM